MDIAQGAIGEAVHFGLVLHPTFVEQLVFFTQDRFYSHLLGIGFGIQDFQRVNLSFSVEVPGDIFVHDDGLSIYFFDDHSGLDI